MKNDKHRVIEIVNFTKINHNLQTIRDSGKIRPPSRQLFELSNFVFINEGRNRPLNWPFGLILKNIKV